MEEKIAEKNLAKSFSEGWNAFKKLCIGDEPSNSDKFRKELEKCKRMLIQCTHMVNQLSLFSSNEVIDEISTVNLKFLLLPAFLGELYLKEVSDDRKSNIENASTYFCDFLKRCHEYMVVPTDLSSYYTQQDENVSPSKDINKMNKLRQEKIQRYKESKEINKRIEVIEKRLKKDDSSVNDDTARELYMDWLKLWINNSIENIASIQMELPILEHMSKIQKGQVMPPEEKPKLKPIKPILITREMIKKQVFGAGYKSLPTMTEDEYFEKELREGKIVNEYNSQHEGKQSEKSDGHSSDDDDEEKLRKARDWDDWKDTHRRGEGNKERHG